MSAAQEQIAMALTWLALSALALGVGVVAWGVFGWGGAVATICAMTILPLALLAIPEAQGRAGG